jgi:hypothetical protein
VDKAGLVRARRGLENMRQQAVSGALETATPKVRAAFLLNVLDLCEELLESCAKQQEIIKSVELVATDASGRVVHREMPFKSGQGVRQRRPACRP